MFESNAKVVVVVVVVRTWVVNGRSLSMNRHRMHLIRVAEHLGVKLPASPPPGTRRPAGRSAKNASKMRQKIPSSPPPCQPPYHHAQFALCVPVSVAHWNFRHSVR